MKRRITIYGLVAGLSIIFGVIATIELGIATMWLGYLIMFIAFGAIFPAVKQYRDENLNGTISFGQGLFVGLGISTVASLSYVLIWEFYLLLTDYSFIEMAIQSMLASQPGPDSGEAELANFAAQIEAFESQYRDPLFRLVVTFLEVFPPGLMVSLLAAGVLSRAKPH